MSRIGRGLLGKLTMLFENWHCGGRRPKKKIIAETDYRKNFAHFKKRTIVKICIFWTVWLAGFVSTSRVLIGVGVFFIYDCGSLLFTFMWDYSFWNIFQSILLPDMSSSISPAVEEKNEDILYFKTQFLYDDCFV